MLNITLTVYKTKRYVVVKYLFWHYHSHHGVALLHPWNIQQLNTDSIAAFSNSSLVNVLGKRSFQSYLENFFREDLHYVLTQGNQLGWIGIRNYRLLVNGPLIQWWKQQPPPELPLSPEQRRVMRPIERCRTAALGGQVEQCDACGHQRIAYNSCRNRHCPKCQSLAKARWLQARLDDLLPVEYFHVVFTLPEQLAAVALQNKRVVYNLLFSAASQTLQTIAADPRHLGADIGFLAVLHTWDQTLRHHPHLHCVVPGGGLSVNGEGWRSCRRSFFLPVNVLARLFRRLFLQGLEHVYDKGELSFHGACAFLAKPTAFNRLIKSVRAREWWVYAKPPFGGPAQVLAYLGR